MASLFLGMLLFTTCRQQPAEQTTTAHARKLYWFIPDGFRAEPDLFKVFEWAREGKLPAIKKMMENGAWGYSIPDFPSHTPTNFASLMTGAHPLVHGVADGPMHTEGSPLTRPSVPGFSSIAKRVPPFWKVMEEAGRQVFLLSIPGSTPPELEHGFTVRGRWGGWGADTPAVIFEPESLLKQRREAGKAFKLFFLGQRLTEFVKVAPTKGWSGLPPSFSPAREAELKCYGASLKAAILDSTNDGKTNYDQVVFSQDKVTELLPLKEGQWSPWRSIPLLWKDQHFMSQVRIKVIKLWPATGEFRIRLFFNNLNRLIVQPAKVAQDLTDGVGPMVDFVDNWPAQLLYEPEDRATFLEEAAMSWEWHRKAAGFIQERYNPDVLIQNIYTPNQMLEARWWHRYLDTSHPEYNPGQAEEAWKDVLTMYQGIDAIMGEALKHDNGETLFVFSSDHGILPLHRQVRLNNLFAQKGWLKYAIDPVSGEPAIDWAKTKVAYLKMAHVYINPRGLGGDWLRGQGAEYEQLREEVLKALGALEDQGVKPLVRAVKWEDAPRDLNLPADRVGDLVLEARGGYQWFEEVTEGQELFTTPKASGYKQAVNPQVNRGMWTPFLIMGPGVKKGVALTTPISHIDQMPTLLHLLGVSSPAYVQGKVLNSVLE